MRSFLFLIVFLPGLISAQEKNKIIPDKNSVPMLIGYCTKEAFSDSAFVKWFNPEFESYTPDSSAVEMLKKKMQNVEIVLVMGTWCDDSRIYVPHLYKVLDEINFPEDEITIIAVDEDKKTEGDEIDGLAVDLVPRIILYKDESELGRIVETPQQSIEEDMLNILTIK